jgi:hypothetical protein
MSLPDINRRCEVHGSPQDLANVQSLIRQEPYDIGEQITLAMTLRRDVRFGWWLWRSGLDSF